MASAFAVAVASVASVVPVAVAGFAVAVAALTRSPSCRGCGSSPVRTYRPTSRRRYGTGSCTVWVRALRQ